MANKPTTPPLPDYFELLRALTGGSSAAAGFAGFGGLGGAANNPAAAFAGIPAMDPAEIDKKIRELEVVHMWLSGQASAVGMSIKAMQYQRDMLLQMSSAREAAGNAFSADDFAKVAAAFNPSVWMAQMAPAGSNAAADRAPRANAKRSEPSAKRSHSGSRTTKRKS